MSAPVRMKTVTKMVMTICVIKYAIIIVFAHCTRCFLFVFFYCFKLQISPETPLIKAFHLFAEKRVSALPVVDDRGTSLYDVWSLLALKINY